MSEQQQEGGVLGSAVREALALRNLTINAASIRLKIDRNALTRFAAGIPLSLELVERFATGLALDVNEWRVLAGYPRIGGELTPQERLGIGIAKLGEQYDDDVPVRRFGGWKDLTHQRVDRILQAAEEELKRRQEQRESDKE
jgi:hypothetical protein